MCSFWESSGAPFPNMIDIVLFFSILPAQRFPVFIGSMHFFQKYVTETPHKSFLDYHLHPCKERNFFFLNQSPATKQELMNMFYTCCLYHICPCVHRKSATSHFIKLASKLNPDFWMGLITKDSTYCYVAEKYYTFWDFAGIFKSTP